MFVSVLELNCIFCDILFLIDEIDYFQEVNRRRPLYNGLLGDFLMDQQRKHIKAVLEDGEFSDEVNSIS